MPTISCGSSGAMALARSVMRTDGILGMKSSPPFIRWKLVSTKSTPCCRVSQKRVISAWVIGRWLAPSLISLSKKGTTEPREPTTLP
ncbi:hypothetical protein D3C80_2037650 [compost metagenome]